MKLRLRPLTPFALRGVVRRLRRIEAQREPRLDLSPVREQLRRFITEMAPVHADDHILAVVDTYVETFIDDFLRPMEHRHHSDLSQLDRLEAQVRAYMDEADALNHDVHNRLTHMNGAVTHALDRVSDPDTPYLDPIPLQRPRENPR